MYGCCYHHWIVSVVMVLILCTSFISQTRSLLLSRPRLLRTRAAASSSCVTRLQLAKKKPPAGNEEGLMDVGEEAIKKKKELSKAEAVRNHFSCKVQDSFNQTSTDSAFSFIIYGEPIVLARHRSTTTGFLYNPSAKHQQSFLTACQSYLPQIPFEGPLEAKMIFYMPRPKSHYKGSKNPILRETSPRWHDSRKDIDNLVKFVFDALNKKAYNDDSQIVALTTAKLYTTGECRTEVSIRKLGKLDEAFPGLEALPDETV